MKKAILAVAIPALLGANSAFAYDLLATDAAKLNFYGELRLKIKTVDDDSGTTVDAYADSIGVSASYNVAPGVDALGLVEFATDPDDSAVENVQAYLGFGTDVGQVTFGKQYIPFDDMGAADLSYEYGENAEFSGLAGGHHVASVNYEYYTDMFWVSAAYGLPEKDAAGVEANPEVVEIAGGVNLDGGLYLGAGVGQDSGVDGTYQENTYWIVEATYTVGDVLLAAQYAENEEDVSGVDSEGYALAGSYNYGMGYAYVGYEATEVGSVDTDFAYLGADYRFNEYARVYAEYGYEDPDNAGEDNKFALGLRVYW